MKYTLIWHRRLQGEVLGTFTSLVKLCEWFESWHNRQPEGTPSLDDGAFTVGVSGRRRAADYEIGLGDAKLMAHTKHVEEARATLLKAMVAPGVRRDGRPASRALKF